MPLKQGVIIDRRYEVVEELGRGGMGAVYRVRHKDLQADFALKELLNPSPDALQQFLAEAQLLAHLDHPHLPRVTNFFTYQGKNYLVMDYVPGEDLEQILQHRNGPLYQEEVVPWMIQVLEALDYIHARGVVHRDIKPGNIKLTPQGQIKLVDFGIAKSGRPGTATSCFARGAFTPFLAPPEQIQGLPTDGRSDLYSLGMTMSYLLTNLLPPPADLAALNGTVTMELQATIRRAISATPAQRWPSALEMKAALVSAGRLDFPAPMAALPPRTPPLDTFRREIRLF